MDYLQVFRAKNVLTELVIAKPRNLIKSYGLLENNNVSSHSLLPDSIGGIGIGMYNNDEYYIRLLAKKQIPKLEKELVAALLKVPLMDLKTIVVGKVKAYNQPIRSKTRPAAPGISIGHFNVSAGTFGCIVTDGRKQYVLSNNHVLADVNSGAIGDKIIQPGRVDGGILPTDQIAILSKFVPIDFNGTNKIDAAIAIPLDNSLITSNFPHSIPNIGVIQGITNPTNKMRVAKYGRTTGYTEGEIVSLNSDTPVDYNGLSAYFEEQLEIEGIDGIDFSQPGDSGSIIIDLGTKKAVGLLFAGGGSSTFANPIANVLQALNVSVL
jgi:hypothetical protein